jgi:hypothetical protein
MFQMLTLKRGYRLYRLQPINDPRITFRECEDTGKYGCYFTDSLKIALGIAIGSLLMYVI